MSVDSFSIHEMAEESDDDVGVTINVSGNRIQIAFDEEFAAGLGQALIESSSMSYEEARP